MRVPSAATLLLCFASWPTLAATTATPAGPPDPLQFQANVGFMHDSNLFRLPDGFPVPSPDLGINSKSDRAFNKGVGLKYDNLIGRQRAIVDLGVSETTFDKNGDLDHVGYDGRLAWMWRIGNDWDGEASYRKRRTLAGLDEFKSKDLIVADCYRLAAGYQLDARWRLNGEVGREDQSHTAAARTSLDVDAKYYGAGFLYKTKAENSIGLQARRTERDYPRAPINDHTEDRISLVALWRLTGLTRLELQAGYVDVSHDSKADSDFSGVQWRATGIWDATGKFRLTAATFRDVRLYEDLFTDYIVVNGIHITPVYAITSKVNLQGEFIYEKRDFRPSSTREDNYRLARLGVSYAPIRNVDLTLSFEAGERKSNFAPLSYDYQAWFGTAKISY